jgi:hypothetical protein
MRQTSTQKTYSEHFLVEACSLETEDSTHKGDNKGGESLKTIRNSKPENL